MDKSKAYSVLGISQGASEDDIKAAYRKLAQKYNVDKYDAGPLKDEAEQKMNEINEAFDTLMSYLRTGSVANTSSRTSSSDSSSSSQGGSANSYASIRRLIKEGRADEAMSELASISGGANNAEWNFLMGSAYYHKGWLDQALRHFQTAVRLDPGNREYEAALRNLQQSQNGNMNGNPYGNQSPDAAAMNCACNTCTLMCCLDACCGMGRGC